MLPRVAFCATEAFTWLFGATEERTWWIWT